ncbi:MAG: T9SS type A sorting domain-containing protein [candidate division Zixibacteria bacterium]|nr:T9SS type A sorting domain-containing protein [candidate division Zixibacteria bacterium]
MKRPISFCCAVLTAVFMTALGYAGEVKLSERGEPADISYTGTSHSFSGEIEIGKIDVSEPMEIDGISYKSIDIPLASEKLHSGAVAEVGEAMLPTLTCFYAVPPDGEIDVSITSVETKEIENISVVPAPQTIVRDNGEDIEISASDDYYSKNLSYPNRVYEISDGGTMRDFRIQAVTFYPVSYNPVKKSIEVATNIRFDVNISGGGFLPSGNNNKVSEAFLPFYQKYLSNPDLLDTVEPLRGKYWIITHDDFYVDLLTSGFTEWKNRKGFDVVVTNLSEISSNPTYQNIRQYMEDQYHNWDIKPDYVLLVGDVRMPGGKSFPALHYYHDDPNPYYEGDGVSDSHYSFLDGDDYFPDVLLGRFPVNNTTELETVIYKTLSYEKDCYLDETDWYTRAVVSAGQSSNPYYNNFVSSRLTVLLTRDMMLANGYTQVDTQFAYSSDWVPPDTVVRAINDGVTYVNYRGWGRQDGWYTPGFDVIYCRNLNNGRKYAYMTAVTCAVGDFEYDEGLCEVWLTAGQEKGGIAFTGNANWNGHSKWTNSIDAGIYWGLFEDSLLTTAQSLLNGKMTLYAAFPMDRAPEGQCEFYFNTYNMVGDPELNLFTGQPGIFDTDYPSTVSTGVNFLHLDIVDNNGAPVEGAMVCALKSGEVFERLFSDASGGVDIPFETISSGELKITLTKRNYAPQYFDIPVQNEGKFVGYLSHAVDDDNNGASHGNGDGVLNPGETAELNITLKNFGTSQNAVGVSLQAVSLAEDITVQSGAVNFGTIAPGASASGDTPVVISLLNSTAHNTTALLRLDISEQSESWQSSLRENVESYYINIRDMIIDDASGNNNGILDPGETANIHLNIINDGTVNAEGLNASIQSPDNLITIIDGDISIGNLNAGGEIPQTSEAFSISAHLDIHPGALFNMPVNFATAPGIAQNSSAGLTVGTVNSYDPIGPDNYGYYCYDNTDVLYSEHPVYEWIEIEDSWDELDINDDTTIEVNLPFTFQYYGQEYDHISVCDNGYIAFGSTWWANFYNCHIPAPQNAPAQLSALWNDFKNTNERTVVKYHYDSQRDAFIIGWKEQMFRDNYRRQTFEIILYNPVTHPTSTGDGIIVYQYNNISYFTSSSVGITSPDKQDGIMYFFEGEDIAGSAGLDNGRAVKFTTEEGMTPVAEDNETLPLRTALKSNYPNPFNNSTAIQYTIAYEGAVKLEIFNLLGQKVNTLIDKEMPAGEHVYNWDASRQTSGIYFIKLTTADYAEVKKAVLIK